MVKSLKRTKMKRSLLFSLAVLAASLCGCSKDAADIASAPQGVRVSFRGDYTAPVETEKTTRVSVDPATGKTAWAAGDCCGIWVVGNSAENVPFTNTTEQTDLFSGTLDAGIASTEPVWGYYPHTATTTFVGTPRSMTIPIATTQVQKGEQTGANSIMTASGELSTDASGSPKITAMHFIHRTAGLCFNVYGSLREASPNPEKLQSLTIHTLDDVPSAITITDPADPAATISYSGLRSMTVTVEKAPNKIGYAKADGTKAFLSVLCGQPYRIASITVTTDQAVYTKDFTSLADGCKTVDPAIGDIRPIHLNLGTFKAVKRFTLGVPGDHNGWDTSAGITGRTDGFFSGMVAFSGNYKYNKAGVWYGSGGEPVTLYYRLSSSGGNFVITGSYYVVADMVGLNASLINSVTLPNSNNWDAKTAPAFVYDADRDLWVLPGVKLATGDEFKIVFNQTWLDNMNRTIVGGGTISPNTPVHLGFDASNNVVVGQGGTYDMTLDLSTYGGTLVMEPVAVP